jgi:hypothetical protein
VMPWGTQKIQFPLRGKPSYPLGWHVAYPAFLQKAQIEKAAPRPCRSPATAFGISFLEDDLGASVRRDHGTARPINKTDILQYNGAFLEMLGLERFPDQSTLRRFLKRLSPKIVRHLVRLHDSLRAYLFALPHPRKLPGLRCGLHGPHYLRSCRRCFASDTTPRSQAPAGPTIPSTQLSLPARVPRGVTKVERWRLPRNFRICKREILDPLGNGSRNAVFRAFLRINVKR